MIMSSEHGFRRRLEKRWLLTPASNSCVKASCSRCGTRHARDQTPEATCCVNPRIRSDCTCSYQHHRLGTHESNIVFLSATATTGVHVFHRRNVGDLFIAMADCGDIHT